MAIVSDAKRFVFVSNPKAASTSIESALHSYQDRPALNDMTRHGYYTRRHIPAVDLCSLLGNELWASYFTFAVVRDPTTWFLSQVVYNVAKGDLAVSSGEPLDDGGVDECYGWLRRYRGQDASPSATQWAFVCAPDREPLVDALWRLEALEDTWPQICHLLALPFLPLQHLNPSRRCGSSVPRLTASGLARIAELYAADFALYRSAQDTWLA